MLGTHSSARVCAYEQLSDKRHIFNGGQPLITGLYYVTFIYYMANTPYLWKQISLSEPMEIVCLQINFYSVVSKDNCREDMSLAFYF